ncbi:MAG: ABC transporter permease [Bdellovibrionales bacterium]|nr:ABC transporter permease [Bdellovibrionales bacterium]
MILAAIKRPNNRLMMIGAGLVLLMVMVALFAPLIAPQDPNLMSLTARYDPPSWGHPFGLDENGSDVLAKVAYGARISLGVALSVVLVSLIIGLTIGSFAGFLGGWMDNLVMRVIDMIYAFPNFLLALGLVAVMGPSVSNVIFAMCLTSWTGYARLVRGEVLHLKEREYVTSARALGGSSLRQVVVHIWPNLVGPLVVNATFAMAGTIIAESSLSFLGLGAPPTTPTWGALLNSGRKILLEAPHVSIFPGLAILTLVLGFNLFGDGLRDYLDPKKH